MTTAAKVAVRRVLAGSELADEWNGNPGWKRRTENLIKRLSRPSKAKRPRGKKSPAPVAADPGDNKSLIKQLRKLGAVVSTTREGVVEGVDLSEGRATAADMPMIAAISSLSYFAVYFDDFGDAELKQLSKLRCLQGLSIMSCEDVTDEGMKHIAQLSKLEELDILYCFKITDVGLGYLTKLSSLKLIKARGTGVTKRGVAAFRKAVPGCKVDTKSVV